MSNRWDNVGRVLAGITVGLLGVRLGWWQATGLAIVCGVLLTLGCIIGGLIERDEARRHGGKS